MTSEPSLWEKCRDAVGHYVHYKGTNGNEYDKENHGKPVEGSGFCKSYHDSHGLCIMVLLMDNSELCVDPTEVEIDYLREARAGEMYGEPIQ
jgi:hypothetical protein